MSNNSDEKFLGKIVNIVDNTIVIKVDFLTEEKKEILYDIYNTGKSFSFSFRKPYKEAKSVQQIRTYFMLLGQILDKLDIPRDKDVINEFDKQILTTLFPCRYLEVFGQSIPIPPSKADMSREDMSLLISNILDAYSELNLKIDGYC
jgi:hypothetical protein